MNLSNKLELNIDLQKHKTSFSDFVLLTIFILFMANAASFLVNKSIVVFIFSGIGIFFLYKKRKFNKKIVVLWFVWVLINIFALLVSSNDSFSLSTFLGVTLRLIMPFFIVSLIGPVFYNKLNKYVFVLVCISSVLFLFDYFLPSLFSSLAPHLNFMSGAQQKQAGGFYLFFYMHSGWVEGRNSGFMWEPGAYAAILVFIISYRLSVNDFKIDKYVFVYLLALITTFSTAGYLALFIITVVFIINNNKYRFFYIAVLLPLFLFYSYNYYKSSDFLEDKIEAYQTQGTDTWEWEFEGRNVTRVNRLGIALITLEESINWPFGFGINKSDYTLSKYGDVAGPNSIAEILHQWGWFGLLFIIYVFYWFFKRYTKLTTSLLLTVAICIVLFSNPFTFKYLIFSLPYYYFLFGKNIGYSSNYYQLSYNNNNLYLK